MKPNDKSKPSDPCDDMIFLNDNDWAAWLVWRIVLDLVPCIHHLQDMYEEMLTPEYIAERRKDIRKSKGRGHAGHPVGTPLVVAFSGLVNNQRN